MDYMLIAISALFLVVGLVGCVVPAIPGPPLAFLGLIVLGCSSDIEFSTSQYIWWSVMTIVATILDFIVPMLGAKVFKGSKWGSRGSLIGTIIGLFFLPIGIILGPFLGAVIGELMGGKAGGHALTSGIGSLLGFILGTALKFTICAYFIYMFILTLL